MSVDQRLMAVTSAVTLALASVGTVQGAAPGLAAQPLSRLALAPQDPVERCFLMTVFDPNDRSVNLRRTANGPVIRAVTNRTRVAMADGTPVYVEPTWTRVKLPSGERGYIASQFLHRTIYTVRDPNDRSVNLRRVPDGPVLRAIANGTDVEFRGIRGSWTQVRLANGPEGYVASRLLQEPSCF